MTSPTLVARRLRVQRIRRAVSAAAVCVFIALFSTIYVQMAAGNDPALSASTAAATSTSATTTTTTTSEETTASDEPVTTAQS